MHPGVHVVRPGEEPRVAGGCSAVGEFDELGRLARAVVPAEDRKRAGPLEQWGRTPVQFSAVAHDGRAVHFRNRLYNVTYQDLLSPILQVTGVDDEGRPAEPRRPEYVLPV